MAKVEQGSTILMHYTIRLDDGSLVDSSSEKGPLSIKLGDGLLFPTVEEALLGLSAGGSATVRVPAADAFGAHAPALVMVVDRSNFPPDVEQKVGIQLDAKAPDSSTLRLSVTKIEGASITLDGNHPLAGRALTAEVQVLSLL